MKLKSSNKESFKFLGILVVLTVLLLALNSFVLKKKDKYAITPGFEQTTPLNLIQITFNEKQYNKLKKKRDKAVSVGILETSDTDYVPATVTYNGTDFKAEVRLKGDWTDHLKGDKWSFRIKLKDDKTILGMRKFSLHHPKTRGYVNEWLYHKVIKKEELIGLRYSFVEGSIHIKLNSSSDYISKPVGIYAIEETFDKRTIENNKRKESVILKFSEDNWWNEVKKSMEVGEADGYKYYNFMKNRIDYPVRAFSEGKMLQDTTMSQYFEFSKFLLKSAREGTMPVSDAFDVKKLALQNAILNLFGATHGNTSINMRFYYNPITSKLEPIAFDGNSGQKLKQFEPFNFIKYNRTIDTVYQKELAYALNKVSSPEYLDKLYRENDVDRSKFEKILKTEFKIGDTILNTLKYNQQIMRQELAQLEQRFNIDGIEISSEPLKEIKIPNFSSWTKNQVVVEKTTAKFKGASSYRLSRENNLRSAFVAVNPIAINFGNIYETSIIAKKGSENYLGLRIQGVYPDRIDAVFNLATGQVKGVSNAGEFKQEKAGIKSLGNGWYRCTLSGKINTSVVRIILGPTSKDKTVLGWEGKTTEKCDVYFIPDSMTFEDITK